MESSTARSPDETGMLQMTPLDGSGEPEPDNAPKSATQFFALPAAKKKKPAPPEPVAAGGPVAEGTGGRGLPSPASSSVSLQPHASPMAQPGGMPGISGPVAGGNGTTTPFQVGQPAALGDDLGDESRAKTYRVYFIVAGLFGLLGAAICLGGVGFWYQMSKKEPVAVVVAPTPAPKVKEKPKQDTGSVALPAPPPPAPRARPRPRPSSGTAAAPRPRPAPAPSVRDVTVKVPTDKYFTGAEITCSSAGFRGRGAFSSGSAKVSGVPPADCEIHFKGGPPAMAKVSGGASTYTCTFPSGVAVCK